MKSKLFIFLLLYNILAYSQGNNVTNVKQVIFAPTHSMPINDTSKLSLPEMNIPTFPKYKDAILKTKELIKKGLFPFNVDTTASWSKLVVNVVGNQNREELDIAVAPLQNYTHESYSYWDSIIVNKYNGYFLEYLFDMALQDSINCYSYDMKTKYSNREIQGLLRGKYNSYIGKNGDSLKSYTDMLHPNLLKKFMLIEYWEQKDFSISSKVIAVCPIYATYDDNANYKGSIQLCWFLLEE